MARPQDPIADTRRWLERAVIGLNLCPFAKAVHVRQQVHYALCPASEFAGVLDALEYEAGTLVSLPPEERDTTLLVVPEGFGEFLLFHELVREAERRLARAGHEGVLQLASFHPRFVFAGMDEDDPANRTNRAPHPTLHLLREDSVARAVAAIPDASAIYTANIRTMGQLGDDGWQALGVEADW